MPDSWRITNLNDLVPTMPRLMGYVHVRHGVRLGAHGQLFFETEGMAEAVGVIASGEGDGGTTLIEVGWPGSAG